MTEMRESQPGREAGTRYREPVSTVPDEPTRWSGWIVFAGIMMIMVGSLHVIQGLGALFNSDYFLVGERGLVVHVDFTVWGWVHLLGGLLVLLGGFALMAGQTWARALAVLLAGASALLNLGFLAAYPLWSAIVIALDVFVIYAVTVHGREMRAS